MVVFTSISIAKAGSSSQSPIFTPFNSTGGGCSTQANTYSDRTRSQGASSDPGEGSLERRLNGRQLYVRRAVDSEGEVLDILVQPRRDQKDTRRPGLSVRLWKVSFPKIISGCIGGAART